jgi:hypothetical protein
MARSDPEQDAVRRLSPAEREALAARQLEQQMAALEQTVRRAAEASGASLTRSRGGPWLLEVPNLARAARAVLELPEPPAPARPAHPDTPSDTPPPRKLPGPRGT